jgi:small-conductance mechanosensitive channel
LKRGAHCRNSEVMRLRSMIAVAVSPLAAVGCTPSPGKLSSARLRDRLPDQLLGGHVAELEIWQWLGLLAGAVLAYAIGLLIARLLLSAAQRIAGLTPFEYDDRLVQAARSPLRLFLFSLLLAVLTRWLAFPTAPQDVADVVARTVGIASATWFVLRSVRLLAEWIPQRVAGESPADVGRARGVRTQVTVLRHVLEVTVVVIAVSVVLLQFEIVRSVGVSLLASAGIAGLVIGLAAQKSISTLLAGIQLSITQPIRIGDTVIVENEFGWVEEVRLTYVVVKIWDLRRLVVPITYFLERPFQNWSKVSPELLGTAEVRADYTADVQVLRAELTRILENEGKSLWDGRAQGIQVTDATDRVITLRLLVSAADPAKLWDLRCLVRERLIAFISAHPEWLPMIRNETRVRSADGGSSSAAAFLPARKVSAS